MWESGEDCGEALWAKKHHIGNYEKKHFVKKDKDDRTKYVDEIVSCSLLKIPLKWNKEGMFEGLALEAEHLIFQNI